MKKIHELTPPELIFLKKHIEFGKEHLIEVLGKKGLGELLTFGRSNEPLVEQIKSSDTETAGNAIRTVNTIITGAFGGWMGFSAMMEYPLASPGIFWAVVSLAGIMGGVIGYESFRFTKGEVVEAVETLQLLQLQLEILEEIHRKRMDEFHEIQTELCTDIISFSPLRANRPITDWVEELEGAIDEKIHSFQSKSTSHFLKRAIAPIKGQIGKNLRGSSPPKTKEAERELSPPIAMLLKTYPRRGATPSWMKKDARKIVITLIPTLFGGFGSLFVYLGGSAQIASAFAQNTLVSFLTDPQLKPFKLATAILTTLYFGFSFLFNSKKSYKREIELKNRREAIIKEEASLTLLDEQLMKFRKIREDAVTIREILYAANYLG